MTQNYSSYRTLLKKRKSKQGNILGPQPLIYKFFIKIAKLETFFAWLLDVGGLNAVCLLWATKISPLLLQL